MSLKSKCAIAIGKCSQFALRLLGKTGGSYPGKLALTIDKHVLSDLAKDYETIIITGTNGKTLTTALTVQALKQKYPNLLTNSTGSNMQQGIVSAFLSHRSVPNEEKIAVLEVDEANLVYVVPFLNPKIVVTTNIFRDQMDRFGEIYTVYRKILDGITLSKDTIVLANGDAPIFNSVSLPNKQLFFGFSDKPEADIKAHYNTDNVLCPHCEKVLHYRHISYANLGHYFCPNCSFKRSELDFTLTSIDELTLDYSKFTIDHHPFTIGIAGVYNIYNALAAYSVARLFDISADAIQTGFTQAQRVFGRQELVQVDDKHVLINLIKNPVGLNQVLELLKLDDNPCTLIAVLNDNYADGRDVSWIWDGQFEELHHLTIEHVVVGGARHAEMHLRLEVAGYEDMQVCPTISEVITAIKQAPSKRVNVLATYTAMLQIRKELATQGYVKGELD
ncbi:MULTISPECIES: Mur ligase family protein [unclassified Granulicatella]|uniref:Mur ligase family protein n=1 Tax=unclassified Granulicatella TaxID=2630493 RepID=UPI001073978C|nr:MULTISPECIES: Mur ligase family protein [unclassified Granulicatella]MBF0780384.1 Mur ligase family protein [Granulicatella sp. 19428wC4_WM01]TFU95472.1 Mur ligase family protein [Granulicatella sp. WM01]